jgi:hypothetical protein
MIIRALELGINEDRLEWLGQLYCYDGTEVFIRRFLEWDDSRLFNTLLYSTEKNTKAGELFLRLKNRQLLKVVFSERLINFTDPNVRDTLSKLNNFTALISDLEQTLSEYLSTTMETFIPVYHVIVKQFTIKSIREQSRNDEGSILIDTVNGPRKFEEESTLFRSIDEKQNDAMFEVYAPMNISDPVKKRKMLSRFSDDIFQMINVLLIKWLKKQMEGAE